MCSFSPIVFTSMVPEAKDKLKCGKGNEFQTKFYFCCNKHQRVINQEATQSLTSLFICQGKFHFNLRTYNCWWESKVLINSEVGEFQEIRAQTFISNHRLTFQVLCHHLSGTIFFYRVRSLVELLQKYIRQHFSSIASRTISLLSSNNCNN